MKEILHNWGDCLANDAPSSSEESTIEAIRTRGTILF